ncbi:hypothetical protein FA13DRAFT_1601539, partial [Coprinellus micaceus]
FLQDTRSIASGSAVLRIMDAFMGKPGDLDIYVPRGSMSAADEFLHLHEYVLVSISLENSRTLDRGEAGISEVRYYLNRFNGALVNVIESSTSSSPTAVFFFHSTIVMNYLSWNALISAYPIMTIDRCGILNSCGAKERPRMEECMAKYRRRGYDFVATSLECERLPNQHICGEFEYCAHTVRGIDD